ncbi:MrcB family domain-containing protein [Paenibacillus rhizolycopersici]|uniref:MrcB family domain-containing protein n=1 Tax=Paenibacillus rhizolycopersici TaxID=2780073 RepID=UPI003D2D888B
MSLPVELADIFRTKQKSYKMVLVLAMIDTWQEIHDQILKLDDVARRFLTYYQYRENSGLVVDSPPPKVASQWESMSLSQVRSLLDTPIEALRSVVVKQPDGAFLTFADSVWAQGEAVLSELQDYANRELDLYHNQLGQEPSFSLHESLVHILQTYTQAKTESFTNHALGALFRKILPEQLRMLPFISEHIKIQGSVGMGNWATVPWLALMDTRITKSTQYGEYIVYLFAEDMSAVYLTFNQGVTKPIQERGRKEGYKFLQQRVTEIRESLDFQAFSKDENIQLTSAGLGRDYQVSTVAYKQYDASHIPSDDQLVADLEQIMTTYEEYVERMLQADQIEDPEYHLEMVEENMDDEAVRGHLDRIQSYINNKGFAYPPGLIENFYLSLKTKPFVILAGVSGTGKTKLIKLFAEAMGATSENGQFTLIPVRPDWSDPSDLIGYSDLSGKFRPGRVTEVLLEASRNQSKPYFICLDEMNLARVEHYFSDMLSILETQELRDGRIATAPIIHRSSLVQDEDREVYGQLTIPENVYLIGTVNMDETTHPFSKKVLDRANTIEFNDIFLAQFPDEESEVGQRPEAMPNLFLRCDYLQLVDAYHAESKALIMKTTDTLVRINGILEEIHAHVGFRIRDAVCFYMLYNQRFGLLTEDEALDHQLLQKILPRIQGSSASIRRVLLNLMRECVGSSFAVNEYIEDTTSLFEGNKLKSLVDQAKYPRSARKIASMLRRLEEDGFTSYWLS